MAKYNYDKKVLKGLGVGDFLGEVKTRQEHIEKGENTITLRLAEKVTSDMLRLAKIVFTPEK